MKYFSHLNTAVEVLSRYDGKIPFHHFIRDFLKLSKKYGSKDRKNIGRLSYAALRIGKAFPKWSIENKIRAGLFLCTISSDDVTTQLLGDYNEVIHLGVAEKWTILAGVYADEFASTGEDLSPGSLFPMPLNVLSENLDAQEFLLSFFQQPDLFIRIRPGFENKVVDRLAEAGVTYEFESSSALRLPINTKLDDLFQPDKEIVIQDYSSQMTGELIKAIPGPVKNVWDACAASGGKSLLVTDLIPGIKLTVTDIRNTIIHNLTARFQQAGIKNYQSFVLDLSSNSELPFDQLQDLVVADVPCSGSGTWSRTPEQLSFFEASMLDRFSQLQRGILSKVTTMIKPGGYLLFITCSVFAKENEDNLHWLVKEKNMVVMKQELIIGYRLKADTLFAALLRSPL